MRSLLALLLMSGTAVAQTTVTIPVPLSATITVPAGPPGPKGDKGDPGAPADTARLDALEAAVRSLQAAPPATGGGTTTPPASGGTTTPPVVVSGPPATPASCTTAAAVAVSPVDLRGGNPADPATWPKLELTVGPSGACPTLAEAMAVVLDLNYQDRGPGHPIDLTLTLDPSVEYVDATSGHYQADHGGAPTWPFFEQTVGMGKVLIRPTPGSGKLVTFRSSPASLYYGKGVFVFDPRFDGADITLDDTRIIGAKGDEYSRLNSIWIEPSEKRATITLRRVILQDADTCLLNGGPNHTVILDTVAVKDCGTGSGLTHNIYIGRVARFEARNVISTGVWEGHLMKVRARVSVLENVRLLDDAIGLRTTLYDGQDKAKSQSSYALDFPNGGDVTITGLRTRKGPLAGNVFHIAYGEEGDGNGGQWPEKALRITDWTALTIRNDGNVYSQPGYIAGVWDATGGLASVSGAQQFGVPEDRMVIRGAYGSAVPGPLPGVTVLPAAPAFDTTPPVGQ